MCIYIPAHVAKLILVDENDQRDRARYYYRLCRDGADILLKTGAKLYFDRDRVFSKSSQYRKQKQWASCQALQNAGRRSIELQTYLSEGDVFFLHNTISYNVGVQTKNQS